MTTGSLRGVAAREVRSGTGGDPGGITDVRWLLSTVKPELWVAAIDYWTTWLIASGARPGTVRLRRYQVGHMAEAFLNRSPWSLTTRDLAGWLATQDWSPETRKSFRSALRSFYGWAAASGRTKHDPAAGLPAVRTFVPPPKPVPDDVLEHALATADDRTRLILLLAALAGLRCFEIAGLCWDDIGECGIRVRGKGGKIRVVPLHPRLAAELDCADHAGRFVFPGHAGPLTAGHVGVLARRALGPGWSAHTLRHRFGTRAYAGTHDLLAVQALLGHADPATTKRYTQLADETLTAAVRSV